LLCTHNPAHNVTTNTSNIIFTQQQRVLPSPGENISLIPEPAFALVDSVPCSAFCIRVSQEERVQTTSCF
jgi:hypothetical protein